MAIEQEQRYVESTRRLSTVNAAGSAAITLLTLMELWGRWPVFGYVAAGQALQIGFNAWVNLWLLRRLGTTRAEALRTVVNLSATLVLLHVSAWPLAGWLWLPFVALAFEQIGTRASWVILAAYGVTMNGLAVLDGQPWIHGAAFTGLAFFCAVITAVRLDMTRAMLVEADRQRAELALAHAETHLAHAQLQAEVRAREQVEVELRHAQKLEAVGRLAAGIAHEINTPVQFVKDSLSFICEAGEDLLGLVDAQAERLAQGGSLEEITTAMATATEEADVPYLREHLPEAAARALDGLQRIAAIVRSMKAFAHPDTKTMSRVDLNEIIENTLTIARGEYKHLADVETYLGPIPAVTCHPGEIAQVVLNLVVNAAHAIADGGEGRRGRIVVITRRDADSVIASVADDGHGIPDAIQARIFEPFFTTKEVGRGSGQGLAIARSVATQHGGTLTFDSSVGLGTTFFLRLPIHRVEVPL